MESVCVVLLQVLPGVVRHAEVEADLGQPRRGHVPSTVVSQKLRVDFPEEFLHPVDQTTKMWRPFFVFCMSH